jgi:hypothetical protein
MMNKFENSNQMVWKLRLELITKEYSHTTKLSSANLSSLAADFS